MNELREQIARCIIGPRNPVPAGSRYSLTELRENRWQSATADERSDALWAADAIIIALRTPAAAARDEIIEECAKVFDEGVVEQSKRLGLPASTKESPGQWMMRVRRGAILALKGTTDEPR